MNSSQPGIGISLSEVTNIERLGFWILVDEKEYFIPFAHYPIFQGASIQQIFNVQRLSPKQLHWPDLDADVYFGTLCI
jgi:hypothetical protein